MTPAGGFFADVALRLLVLPRVFVGAPLLLLPGLISALPLVLVLLFLPLILIYVRASRRPSLFSFG